MCISCEIHDKWPPFIEFIVWFLLQGISVGNHFGVWVVLQSHIIDITNSTYRNASILNISSTFMPTTLLPLTTTQISSTQVGTTITIVKNESFVKGNASFVNGSAKFVNETSNKTLLILYQTAEQQWESLLDFRKILLVFCIIGAALYILHMLVLLPNIIQSCRVPDPISLKDTGNVYFRSRLKMHALMLIMETIVFDIPVGCLTMELLSLIWEGPLTEVENMNASQMILALSLVGLAFIALYKGKFYFYLMIYQILSICVCNCRYCMCVLIVHMSMYLCVSACGSAFKEMGDRGEGENER